MLGFLAFVVGVLVVGGLLFLGAALLLGRGETQPPADLDRSPVELPDDRSVTGDDVRALQISVAFRGYRMSEVDWLLDQFAQALDDRDRVIADLRSRAHPSPHPRHAVPEKETAEPETPGTAEPETPGTARPGTARPGTARPGTARPGTAERPAAAETSSGTAASEEEEEGRRA